MIVSRDQLATRESQAGPYGVAERSVVPTKPGNSGGGKGASVKDGRSKQQRTWGLTMSLATPSCVQKLQTASHVPSGVFSESRMR